MLGQERGVLFPEDFRIEAGRYTRAQYVVQEDFGSESWGERHVQKPRVRLQEVCTVRQGEWVELLPLNLATPHSGQRIAVLDLKRTPKETAGYMQRGLLKGGDLYPK